MFLDYTLLRMKNAVMQLGLPGSVPLPKSDDEHSPKRKGGTGAGLDLTRREGTRTATALLHGRRGWGAATKQKGVRDDS